MSLKATIGICGIVCVVVGVLSYSAGFSRAENKKDSRVYELRTYTTEPGRLPALNARFKNHTMRLFEKHGIKNVMYWIPTDEKLKDNTLIYVVSHASMDAAKKSWSEFGADPEWRAAAEASEKDGKILAKRPEAVYMTLTDYSPSDKN
jgi:hypothetical protein